MFACRSAVHARHVQSPPDKAATLGRSHTRFLGLTSRRNSFTTLNVPLKPQTESVKKEHVDDALNSMILTKRTALFYENLYEQLLSGHLASGVRVSALGAKGSTSTTRDLPH